MINESTDVVGRPFNRRIRTHYFLNDKPVGVNEEGIKALLHSLSRTKKKILVVQMNAREESEGISRSDLPGIITEHMVELIKVCRFKAINMQFQNNPVKWVIAPEVRVPETRKGDFGFGVADEHEEVTDETSPSANSRSVPRQPPEGPPPAKPGSVPR
ncbi:MAG: hypothetical protein K9N23_06610 [Akkermansiaceae bacterium]|nr:hypothetical protein [Akkermansiaceae bacterium]MCF7731338.1 hypothetical protein [Akkermansiaceae bacterium]